MERLSSSYYVTEFDIIPGEGEQYGKMSSNILEKINQEVYSDNTQIMKTDRPVMIKAFGKHFLTYGNESVPSSALVAPEGVVERRKDSIAVKIADEETLSTLENVVSPVRKPVEKILNQYN